MRLDEFSKDQLQWILNKAVADILDINYYIETVTKNDMVILMEEEIKKRTLHRAELTEIIAQVKKAMGDIAVREIITSN